MFQRKVRTQFQNPLFVQKEKFLLPLEIPLIGCFWIRQFSRLMQNINLFQWLDVSGLCDFVWVVGRSVVSIHFLAIDWELQCQGDQHQSKSAWPAVFATDLDGPLPGLRPASYDCLVTVLALGRVAFAAVQVRNAAAPCRRHQGWAASES